MQKFICFNLQYGPDSTVCCEVDFCLFTGIITASRARRGLRGLFANEKLLLWSSRGVLLKLLVGFKGGLCSDPNLSVFQPWFCRNALDVLKRFLPEFWVINRFGELLRGRNKLFLELFLLLPKSEKFSIKICVCDNKSFGSNFAMSNIYFFKLSEFIAL